MIRRRVPVTTTTDSLDLMDTSRAHGEEPLLASTAPTYDSIPTSAKHIDMASRTSWLVYAVASGACAAFNGVFAKLTTTELTTSFANNISTLLHLGNGNHVVEYLIRALFFGLNLAFNAVMWFLFTRALTLASSTTRVSILNTSSNFMLTAFLGLIIFRESLPPLWFLGAVMLIIGNVIIGRREDDGDSKVESVDQRERSERTSGGNNMEAGLLDAVDGGEESFPLEGVKELK